MKNFVFDFNLTRRWVPYIRIIASAQYWFFHTFSKSNLAIHLNIELSPSAWRMALWLQFLGIIYAMLIERFRIIHVCPQRWPSTDRSDKYLECNQIERFILHFNRITELRQKKNSTYKSRLLHFHKDVHRIAFLIALPYDQNTFRIWLKNDCSGTEDDQALCVCDVSRSISIFSSHYDDDDKLILTLTWIVPYTGTHHI